MRLGKVNRLGALGYRGRSPLLCFGEKGSVRFHEMQIIRYPYRYPVHATPLACLNTTFQHQQLHATPAIRGALLSSALGVSADPPVRPFRSCRSPTPVGRPPQTFSQGMSRAGGVRHNEEGGEERMGTHQAAPTRCCTIDNPTAPPSMQLRTVKHTANAPALTSATTLAEQHTPNGPFQQGPPQFLQVPPVPSDHWYCCL